MNFVGRFLSVLMVLIFVTLLIKGVVWAVGGPLMLLVVIAAIVAFVVEVVND